MQTNRFTLKPYLGLVLKEINFAEDKTSLLVYSKKYRDIRLLPSDLVMELEKPEGFDAKLYLFEKRRESIIRSFVEEFVKVDVEQISVSSLENDLPILINRLLI